MDRGAWQATVHGVAASDMTEQITHTHGIPHIILYYAMVYIASYNYYAITYCIICNGIYM